jgi:hypothetical protein
MERQINSDSKIPPKYQKISVIDTGVKTSPRTVFSDPIQCSSVERLINSVFTLKQMWNSITLRHTEDGCDMFSKPSVLTRTTQYKGPEDIYS